MNINELMDSERGNEIVNAAIESENSSGFCELIKSPLSNRVKSSYGIGFIEGAVWADEHNRKPTKEEVLEELRDHAERSNRFYNLMEQLPPLEQLAILQMEEGRKQAIDKACEWLEENIRDYCNGFEFEERFDEMIVDFRNAIGI